MSKAKTSIPAQDTFDVVIIGSGVAGALIADALRDNDVRVLLLEAGETGVDRDLLVWNWAQRTIKNFPGTPYTPSDPKKIPGPE